MSQNGVIEHLRKMHGGLYRYYHTDLEFEKRCDYSMVHRDLHTEKLRHVHGEPDECNMAAGYHTNPHKGCLLR